MNTRRVQSFLSYGANCSLKSSQRLWQMKGARGLRQRECTIPFLSEDQGGRRTVGILRFPESVQGESLLDLTGAPSELPLANKPMPDRLRKPRYPWKSGPPARQGVSQAQAQSVPAPRHPTQSLGRRRKAVGRPAKNRGTCPHNREKQVDAKFPRWPRQTRESQTPSAPATSPYGSREG